MIEIKHLTKTYSQRGGDKHALSNISLQIGTGMFGLLGPNGAGKTTLMRILAGILRPTSGTAVVFGNDLQTEQGRFKAKQHLGYLPQEIGLYPNLTGMEFLKFVAGMKGVTGIDVQRQVERVLEIVRLADVAKTPLKAYSGGMKRRIGIAQALLGDVQLLIVDEPTTGLDPEERLRIRNMFAEIALQSTIILSTHIIEDISQSCRSMALIANGHIKFEGDPLSLAKQAQDHVWQVNQRTPFQKEGFTVASTLQVNEGLQYRLIGDSKPTSEAVPLEPTLEDGYLYLMQSVRAPTSS